MMDNDGVTNNIDNAIVSGVVSVQWIAQSVFSVTLADPRNPSGTDASSPDEPASTIDVIVSLPSVEIPRTSCSKVDTIIRQILEDLHRHTERVLRMDFMSRLPLEGYADVLYRQPGAEEYQSLEQMVLRMGVARVCRPGLHWSASLLQHEEAGQYAPRERADRTAPVQTFSGMLAAKETQPQWNQRLEGVVVDVVRGDYLRVLVKLNHCSAMVQQVLRKTIVRDDADDDVPRRRRGPSGDEVVLLVSVAAVRCENVSSETGFNAMRFAQQYFYQEPVEVMIHNTTPRDKDQANTTQEERLHQLAHIRGTVTLLRHRTEQPSSALLNNSTVVISSSRALRDQYLSSSSLGRGAPPSYDGSPSSSSSSPVHMLRYFDGDISRVLLHFGLAKLRPMLDASDPRPTQFAQLLRDIDALAASSNCRTLLEVWQRYVADGDTLGTAPPTKHTWMPLKLMCPLSFLLTKEEEGRVTPGYVHNVRISKVTTPPRSKRETAATSNQAFLCVTVLASLDSLWVKELMQRERQRYHPTASIVMDPVETEWCSAKLARSLSRTGGASVGGGSGDGGATTVFAQRDSDQLGDEANLTEEDYGIVDSLQAAGCYGSILSIECNIEIDQAADISNIQTSVVPYDRQVFRFNKHTPQWYSQPSTTALPVRFTLQRPEAVLEKVFVVDVKVILQNGAQLKQTSVYVLHKDGARKRSGGGSSSAGGGGVGGGSGWDSVGETILIVDKRAEEEEEQLAGATKADETQPQQQTVEQGGLLPSLLTTTGLTVHALLDFYLPITTPQGSGSEEEVEFLNAARSLLMFLSVECAPRRVVVVNGQAGFAIDSTTFTALRPPLLSSFSVPLPSPSSGNDDVRDMEQNPASSPAPKQDLLLSLIHSLCAERRIVAATQQQGTEDSPLGVSRALGSLSLVASAEVAACAELLPRQLGGNNIPLMAFALTPRQLFVSNPDHHQSIVSKADRQAKPTYAHVDSSFIRLRMSRLPNLFRANLEWLPSSVRDVQQNLVLFSSPAESSSGDSGVQVYGPAEPSPPPTPSPYDESSTFLRSSVELTLQQSTSFLAMERSLASLLAVMIMAAPRAAGPLPGFESCEAYYKVTPDGTLHATGLLYSLPINPTQQAATSNEVRRVIILGTKSARDRHAISEPDECIATHRIASHSLTSLVTALGVQSLIQPSADSEAPHLPQLDADDAADRPMGLSGLGQAATSDILPGYWLYRPSLGLPSFAVIGEPLVAREEDSLDSVLPRHSPKRSEGTNDPPRPPPTGKRMTRRVAVQYVPFRCGGRSRDPIKSLYRMMSYGQLGRGIVFQHRLEQVHRGKDIADYFSLLLRKTKRFGFPDGMMKVIGNAHEPLYLFYLARRSLRFMVSMNWNLFRPCVNVAEQHAPMTMESVRDLDEEEQQMFEAFVQVAHDVCVTGMQMLRDRGLLKMGEEAGQDNDKEERSVAYRAEAFPADHFVMLSFYPVEVVRPKNDDNHGPSDEAVSSDDRPPMMLPSEPQRTFSNAGTVFGRLPSLRCRLQWVGTPRYFDWKFEFLAEPSTAAE